MTPGFKAFLQGLAGAIAVVGGFLLLMWLGA